MLNAPTTILGGGKGMQKFKRRIPQTGSVEAYAVCVCAMTLCSCTCNCYCTCISERYIATFVDVTATDTVATVGHHIADSLSDNSLA